MSSADPAGETAKRRRGLLLGLGAVALLGACGELPQPFRGRPGAVARRLRLPPSYRVAVPYPGEAMLGDNDAALLSEALAEALNTNEVPAVAGPALPLDWQLVVVSERRGSMAVPRYALRDADGQSLGQLDGRPLPLREWAEGGSAVYARIAQEVAPQLATLLARADAARRTGDERATGAGTVPVLRLLPVRGAPGDGNRSLTAKMGDSLAGRGFRVQEQAEGAQFAVSGEVTMATVGRGMQRVEIIWIVSRRDGEDLGRVAQLNEVPAGSLNGLWGDVAFVVAEEAAGGVRDVVMNAGGFGAPPAGAPAADAPAAPAAAPGTPAAPAQPAAAAPRAALPEAATEGAADPVPPIPPRRRRASRRDEAAAAPSLR